MNQANRVRTYITFAECEKSSRSEVANISNENALGRRGRAASASTVSSGSSIEELGWYKAGRPGFLG